MVPAVGTLLSAVVPSDHSRAGCTVCVSNDRPTLATEPSDFSLHTSADALDLQATPTDSPESCGREAKVVFEKKRNGGLVIVGWQ